MLTWELSIKAEQLFWILDQCCTHRHDNFHENKVTDSFFYFFYLENVTVSLYLYEWSQNNRMIKLRFGSIFLHLYRKNWHFKKKNALSWLFYSFLKGNFLKYFWYSILSLFWIFEKLLLVSFLSLFFKP